MMPNELIENEREFRLLVSTLGVTGGFTPVTNKKKWTRVNEKSTSSYYV